MTSNNVNSTTIVAEKSITFYTSRTTPACRAVKMVATHLNIPLTEVALQCYIDTRTEKFRKINPCHTLPVIDDDGYILWESRAIMQYLCNQYAPDSNLYPSDPQKRATVDRLLNFDLKTLSHAVMAVHSEFMFPSEYSTSRGEKFIAVTDALTLLEIFLINMNYVACNHLTIADISILASVTLLEIAVEFDLSTYPNIWLWINRLRNELPYYESLTKMAHDELRALIQSVRDAHDEWSSPLPKCAFTPDGSDKPSCINELHVQYQRLFSNSNAQKEVANILAEVIPSCNNNSTDDIHHNHNHQKSIYKVNNNQQIILNHNNHRNNQLNQLDHLNSQTNKSSTFSPTSNSINDFNEYNNNNITNNNIHLHNHNSNDGQMLMKKLRRRPSFNYIDEQLMGVYNDHNRSEFTKRIRLMNIESNTSTPTTSNTIQDNNTTNAFNQINQMESIPHIQLQ